MPARSRRQKRLAKKNGKPRRNKLYILLFVILLIPLVFIFSTKYWNKHEKLSIAVARESGDVSVLVFDPIGKKIVSVLIPADMQIKAARQFGSWKVKSLRELGENEGIGGKLVAESVLYYFKFPVIVWADEPAIGFSRSGFFQISKAVFSPYQTNLGFGDRIRLGLFSLNMGNLDREDINIVDYFSVKKTRLIDGGEGYLLTGKLPNSLYAIFSDPQISKSQVSVKIINASERRELALSTGEALEVLGAKIAAVNNEDPIDIDCEVSGQDKALIKKISKLFDCDEYIKDIGSFDIQIKLGEEFAKRF